MSEWISVGDRLPDIERRYLIWSWGAHGIAEWYDGCWLSIAHNVESGITHWMPLPDPPEN